MNHHFGGFNRGPRKGNPINYDLTCTLEELYTGKIRKIKIKRNIKKNGKIEQEDKIIEINVLPGWKDGTKITFEKIGDEIDGIIPGDLICCIKEAPHNKFKRNGNDLKITIEINDLNEIKKPFTKIIQLLDGSNITFTFPSIKRSDYVHIIRQKGMPIRHNGNVVGYGDLYVNFLFIF